VETGLLHLHRTLGYVVFVVALVDLVLVMTKARSDERFARVLGTLHGIGLLGAGRLNLLVGLAVWAMAEHYPVTTWWTWVSLLLWGPVEGAAARLLKPEISLVADGGAGSGRMAAGAAIQLVAVVLIFGLMSARP